MSKQSEIRNAAPDIGPVVFLAGFTFLIYEVSWHRLLSLVLGTTVTASTLVLASFMAGFGAGAYFWGRRADSRDQVGSLLAALLAGVGVFSGLDYFLFARGVPTLYGVLAGAGVVVGFSEVIVFAVAAILLFVPAFLMGGIFPLASKLAVKTSESLATTLGRLYAVETLGSTTGGLIAGFVLLGALGQAGTVALAVVTNLCLGAWLLLKTRGVELISAASAVDSAPLSPSRKSRRTAAADPAVLRRAALIGSFVCGFSILGLQVLWMRIFRIYLTNTSYTFALVSSLVILGLFTGSALFKRRAPGIRDYQQSLLSAVLLMALTTGIGLLMLIRLPDLLMFPFQELLSSPLARVLLLPLVASLLVIFPPSVFSGYAFPLACRMVSSGRDRISGDVGLVLMVNTAGSVLGPVLAAFVLMPWLGVTLSVVLIVVLLVATGLVVMHRQAPSSVTGALRPVLYGVGVLLLVAIIARPAVRILPPSFSAFDRDVLYYLESVEGTLSVGVDKGTRTESKYTFVNNAAVIGSTYDAVKVVKMVGHFPFLLGLDCRDVLVIGFGIGVTTSAIAAHEEVESIECVELVTGLRDAAIFYRDLNRNVVADPRLSIISGDGRHHLQLTSKKYDLISCDPTHPILGSGNLYTREYFSLCRDHLNPGGMVSQYLPLHKLRTEEFLGIVRTFESVFPHSTVWLGHYHAVLLGSTEPIDVDFADWTAEVEAVGKDPHFYVDPYHLAATLMLDGETIAELGAHSRINSDNRSYTEFFAPACLDEGNLAKNLRFLQDNRVDLETVFHNIDDPRLMARYLAGNELLTESLFEKMSGQNERSLELLRQAARVNPEDQEYPFLIRLYY